MQLYIRCLFHLTRADVEAAYPYDDLHDCTDAMNRIRQNNKANTIIEASQLGLHVAVMYRGQ